MSRLRHQLTSTIVGITIGVSALAAPPALAADELTPVGGWLVVDQPNPFSPSKEWLVVQQAAVEVPKSLEGKTLQVSWSQGDYDYSPSSVTPDKDGIIRVGAGNSAGNTAAAAEAALNRFKGPLEVRATDTASGRTYTGTVSSWEVLPRPVIKNVKKSGTKSRPVISGRVTTSTGKPLGNLPVNLMQVGEFSGSSIGWATTDGKGRFTIRAEMDAKPGIIQVSTGGLSESGTNQRVLGQAYSRQFRVR